MRLIAVLLLLFLASPAVAEQACPKYREGCVPLDTFKCDTITRSKTINRLCYEPTKQYLIIWLGKNNVPYHYCDIPQSVIDELKAAPSMGHYYNSGIRSKPNGEHGPYDCRDHPVPKFD